MSFKLRIWQAAQQVTITGLPELVAKEVERLSNQGFIVSNESVAALPEQVGSSISNIILGKPDNGVSVDMEKPESIVDI